MLCRWIFYQVSLKSQFLLRVFFLYLDSTFFLPLSFTVWKEIVLLCLLSTVCTEQTWTLSAKLFYRKTFFTSAPTSKKYASRNRLNFWVQLVLLFQHTKKWVQIFCSTAWGKDFSDFSGKFIWCFFLRSNFFTFMVSQISLYAISLNRTYNMPSIQFSVNDMRYKYLIFSLVNSFGGKKKKTCKQIFHLI